MDPDTIVLKQITGYRLPRVFQVRTCTFKICWGFALRIRHSSPYSLSNPALLLKHLTCLHANETSPNLNETKLLAAFARKRTCILQASRRIIPHERLLYVQRFTQYMLEIGLMDRRAVATQHSTQLFYLTQRLKDSSIKPPLSLSRTSHSIISGLAKTLSEISSPSTAGQKIELTFSERTR